VIPISDDEVCVYWGELRHVSNYKRVVLDDLYNQEHFGTAILDDVETMREDITS
jgi:hypothetical protein